MELPFLGRIASNVSKMWLHLIVSRAEWKKEAWQWIVMKEHTYLELFQSKRTKVLSGNCFSTFCVILAFLADFHPQGNVEKWLSGRWWISAIDMEAENRYLRNMVDFSSVVYAYVIWIWLFLVMHQKWSIMLSQSQNYVSILISELQDQIGTMNILFWYVALCVCM